MSANKRYYFLKLKENFFREETILLLEDCKDGFLYTNILLKMYLLSLKHEGQLLLTEGIAYTPAMIASLTHHQTGTVEKALQVFTELGLVEELQDGSLYMSNIQTMIGSSSTEAERKRQERLRLGQQLLLSPEQRQTSDDSKRAADNCGQTADTSGQLADICPEMSEKCPPEYRDKSIELRDQSSELRNTVPPPVLGRYQNVRLTQSELSALQKAHPTDWQEWIERLSGYMASTGKRYRNHLATIEQWADRERQQPAQTVQNIDYRVQEGETI